MNQVLSIFTTLLNSIKDYGVVNVIKTFMVMIMFGFVVRIMIDPTFLFKAYEQWTRTNHEIELTVREKNDLEVSKRMPVYLYKYHAERVFVVQYHNGISDWRYGSMRFEEHLPGIVPLKYEHSNIHLSWLRLPNYLRSNTLFIGSIEDFKNIDHTLYDSFIKCGTKYIAFINLTDTSGNPVGVFGVSWNKEIDLEYHLPKIKQYLYEDRGTLQNYVQPQLVNAKIK